MTVAANFTVGMMKTLVIYWRSMAFFLCGGRFNESPDWFRQLPKHAQVHLYSLSLIFEIWGKDHYRSGTFQQDMLKNLRNVAIPRTGIPLSFFCFSKASAMAFVLLAYPIIALIAAIHAAIDKHDLSLEEKAAFASEAFQEQLLTPRDWFSLWRLNCRLASYHSEKTKAKGYQMEDKWTFPSAPP